MFTDTAANDVVRSTTKGASLDKTLHEVVERVRRARDDCHPRSLRRDGREPERVQLGGLRGSERFADEAGCRTEPEREQLERKRRLLLVLHRRRGESHPPVAVP